MCTMAVVIVGVVVVVDEVIAFDEFCLGKVRRQDVSTKVFVGDAGINDRYGHTFAGSFCPGRLQVDAAFVFSGKIPLECVVRIAGGGKGLRVIVRLGKDHIRPASVLLHLFLDPALWDFDHLERFVVILELDNDFIRDKCSIRFPQVCIHLQGI